MSTKENVLTLLEESRGQSISGERIAQTLKISRNSVWKAINELKKDGYKIGAATNKGYYLSTDNDILSVQGILPFLTHREISDQIKVYQSLDSTNKTAKELAIGGANHGTVIISDSQTMGRGRYNRSFFSPPDSGIYMSLVLHPEHLGFQTPTLMTTSVAVAICDAIKKISNKTPTVKWVNDIYCNDKKICGILTEAVTDFESGNIEWIVVGIGINFNMPKGGFPDELHQIAGALFSDEDTLVTRNQLVAEVINHILDLPKYDPQQTLKKYKNSLFVLGQKIKVNGVQKSYEATAIDIDDTGRLIVKTENDEIRILSSGEISILC